VKRNDIAIPPAIKELQGETNRSTFLYRPREKLSLWKFSTKNGALSY